MDEPDKPLTSVIPKALLECTIDSYNSADVYNLHRAKRLVTITNGTYV